MTTACTVRLPLIWPVMVQRSMATLRAASTLTEALNVAGTPGVNGML